jgi:hypothetical protein
MESEARNRRPELDLPRRVLDSIAPRHYKLMAEVFMASRADGLFDRRILARNLKSGKITRKELEQYLASLPDAGPRAMPLFGERDTTPRDQGARATEHGKS